jgi:hypothetical protein
MGKVTGRGVSPKRFDQLMAMFAVIAGDEYWMDRTSAGPERRLRWVIRTKLTELSAVTKTEHSWAYVQGIHDQARLSQSLDDCPAEYLLSIVQMLDTKLRHEMKRVGLKARDLDAVVSAWIRQDMRLRQT